MELLPSANDSIPFVASPTVSVVYQSNILSFQLAALSAVPDNVRGYMMWWFKGMVPWAVCMSSFRIYYFKWCIHRTYYGSYPVLYWCNDTVVSHFFCFFNNISLLLVLVLWWLCFCCFVLGIGSLPFCRRQPKTVKGSNVQRPLSFCSSRVQLKPEYFVRSRLVS